MKVDWNTDQDMNWKIGWDIGLNVGYWDTGLGTNFDIGLGFVISYYYYFCLQIHFSFLGISISFRF